MSEQWTEALKNIKDQIGAQNFDTWIAPVRFVSRNKNEVVLDVPNKFFRDWLTEHYIGKLEDVLSSSAKHAVRVVFQVNERAGKQARPEKIAIAKKEDNERDRPQRTSNLVSKYTFKNFVIGASNQFANAACVAAANKRVDNNNRLSINVAAGLATPNLANAKGH